MSYADIFLLSQPFRTVLLREKSERDAAMQMMRACTSAYQSMQDCINALLTLIAKAVWLVHLALLAALTRLI